MNAMQTSLLCALLKSAKYTCMDFGREIMPSSLLSCQLMSTTHRTVARPHAQTLLQAWATEWHQAGAADEGNRRGKGLWQEGQVAAVTEPEDTVVADEST